MIFRYFKSIILSISFFCFIYSNNWENLTSTLNITDTFIKNNKIYASTEGGVIIIDKDNNDINVLDFNDEIYPLDLLSIYVDSNSNILLGSNSPRACLQVINHEYKHINTIFLDGLEEIDFSILSRII